MVRAWLGAGALVLLLVTSGCSDDPQPKVEPTVDPPTSSATETAADEPEAWEVKSKAGAVAFAKHWIDVLNDAMSTSEVEDMRDVSARSCATCLDFADRLELIESKGGSFSSEGWRVLGTAQPQFLGERAVVALRLREGAEVVKEAADSRPVRNPPAKATWAVEMAWQGSRWTVSDFRVAG